MHPRSLSLPLATLCLMIGAAVAPATAQRPSSWQAAPAPAVPSSSVDHRGKLLFFVHNGNVHVFSAATRTWASHPVSATASIRNTNDWLLVEDHGTIAAIASATGRFEVLPASGTATILNSPSGRNDGIILALDGSTLWSFTGFTGRWTSRTVATSALIGVQRNVAIIADGTNLWGLSALFGTWVPHTMTGVVQATGVGDTLGWVTDGTDAHGFSAIRNTWSSAPVPPGAPSVPTVERDVAAWIGMFEILAFSGARGAFGHAITAIQTTVEVSDHVAHAYSADGRRHWLFSVPNAQWTPWTTTAPASSQLVGATVLLTEANAVHAYSALESTVATLPLARVQTAVNTTVAAALDANTRTLSLYSAFTGAWHTAPAGAQPVLPQLARNGALLSDGGGTAWAFSARSGRFVPRTLGGNAVLHLDPESSLLATEDDGALAMFEPRREVWLQTPITAADRPLTVRIWRTTLVAFTQTEGIGFSSLHGTVERVALPGQLLDQRASSEVGAAITSAGVVGYSAVSDLRTEAQFPEFRRMYGRGSRLDLEATGTPLSLVGSVTGLASARPVRIPGLGELVLDPTFLVPLTLASLDSAGQQTLRLPIPDDPLLRGLELGFQAVVLPPGGTPYLTRLATFRIQ